MSEEGGSPPAPGDEGGSRVRPEPWKMALAEFREAFPATRCFQRYSPEDRATLRASHRVGHRQRTAVGEHFYTHEYAPGLAFPTHARAVEAAHLKVVQEALRKGLRVPLNVLLDLPRKEWAREPRQVVLLGRVEPASAEGECKCGLEAHAYLVIGRVPFFFCRTCFEDLNAREAT